MIGGIVLITFDEMTLATHGNQPFTFLYLWKRHCFRKVTKQLTMPITMDTKGFENMSIKVACNQWKVPSVMLGPHHPWLPELIIRSPLAPTHRPLLHVPFGDV